LRIAAEQRRHDRGVGHAEPLDATHPKLRVYDRVSIGPHAAGSDRMVDSIRPQSYGFAQRGLVFAEPAIQHLLADCSHGGCPKDLFGKPNSLDERIQITWIGEEVRVDQGSLANVGALDADLAAAVGP